MPAEAYVRDRGATVSEAALCGTRSPPPAGAAAAAPIPRDAFVRSPLRGGSLATKLIRHSGNIDIHIVRAEKTGLAQPHRRMTDLLGTNLPRDCGWGLGAVAAVTLVNWFLQSFTGYWAIALVYLIHVSVLMTGLAFAILLVFGFGISWAFKTIRPIFRARPKIQAEVTGRLTESLGGVRVVKGYHAEEREEKIFAGGVQRLLDNVLKTLTATSLMSLSGAML